MPEKDYLEILIEISNNPSFASAYDELRISYHQAVLKKHGLESCYTLSKALFDNLNLAIGFNLGDFNINVLVYANRLEKLLRTSECVSFIKGDSLILKTEFGELFV